MFKDKGRDHGQDPADQKLDAGEFYPVRFRGKIVNDQNVQRKKKRTHQHQNISATNGKTIRDAEKIKTDQSHDNGCPDKGTAFLFQEKSDNRDNDNIAGSEKPAFPTVVYLMPNCWKLLAAKSAMPQAIPPIQRSRVLYGEDVVVDVEGSAAAEAVSLERFKRKITGTRTAAPIRERTPLKVKGPTYSMPTLWATKAIPQMVAARSRQREFFRGIFCVFMIKESFRVLCGQSDI